MTFQYSLNIFKQYMYITTSTEKRIRYSVTMHTILVTTGINSKSFPSPVHSVQCKIVSEMTYNVSSGTLNPTIPYRTRNLPKLQRPMRAENTASQAANHHRLMNHVILGLNECKKVNSLYTDSRQLRAEYCIVGVPHNTVI